MLTTICAEKKLVACFNIHSHAGRKDAVKSIFEILGVIVGEEEELFKGTTEQQAGGEFIADTCHAICNLISAMDCLNNVFPDCCRFESKAGDAELPF